VRSSLYAVDELAAALRGFGTDVAPAKVAAALREVRVDARTLAPFASWAPGRYTRNLVTRTDAFELVALCWDAGARSAIHDHAGSDCTFVVVDGTLTCENYRLVHAGDAASRPLLTTAGEEPLAPGDLDFRSGEQAIHRVGVTAGRAMTLHVYAKPLDVCLAYDEGGNARAVRSVYDTVPR
jgi:cysteine dioxygenase